MIYMYPLILAIQKSAKEDILNKTNLEILASGEEVGVSILCKSRFERSFSFGHLEYDRDTLAKEYLEI